MKRQKRERLDVIKDILGVILLNRNLLPTKLLYKTNMSPNGLKEYTRFLLDKGLINKSTIIKPGRAKIEHAIYNLTELGRQYLEDYKAVEMFTEKYGLND